MPHSITKIIDLGEATALLTLGFELVRLEASNTGQYKVFIFETMHPNSSTIFVEETIDNYKRRKLQVDAYSFYWAGKELKNRIHEHNESINK
jgi:hypothetical protein